MLVGGKFRYVAFALLGALTFGSLVSGCEAASTGGSQSAEYSGDVAAYVGDEVIYEDEISDYTSEFRLNNGLEDDSAWASYLTSSDLTGKTWRESVIRQKADRILVESRAAELGIEADADLVDERIAEVREQSGVGDDDEAWESYLAARGQTPESLRDSYEYSSIEQQVLISELDLTGEVRSEMCDDYLKTNLADQVVRHFYAFEFSLDDKQAAQALLSELEGLTADELYERFVGAGDDASSGLQAVDLRWDFIYNEAVIDPDLKLRHAKVDERSLYGKVLKGTDTYRVVYCAEREEFAGDISYESIRSESLKGVIADLTISSQWSALLSQYLSKLETEADVQVVTMPEGLSYDIVEEE